MREELVLKFIAIVIFVTIAIYTQEIIVFLIIICVQLIGIEGGIKRILEEIKRRNGGGVNNE